MKKNELLLLWRTFGIQTQVLIKIIMKKTELTKEQFFLINDIKVNTQQLQELKEIFQKVAFGYPLEYILEKAEFYGLDFYVDKWCLIPRDDTEIMVSTAIDTITKQKNNIVYIDVWTWSWAIPISIIDNVWDNIDTAFALDISEDALKIAQKNINLYKLNTKIILKKSNLLDEIFIYLNSNTLGEKSYIITANLPYIKEEDYGNMDKDVILHEPAIALYGWKNTGFEMYEKLFQQIYQLKKSYSSKINNCKEVILFIEIGFDQKHIAINFIHKKNLKYQVFQDTMWIARCIKIQF